jgi:SpoVK/Ycf46/Vps4 family AAA+-type ATPase
MTGKTSTAECVAANTNRPLFPITCGDIGGATAKEVEDNLESYFDLAREWGCVLLLDEADVFLGERTKGDFVQNSLVSGNFDSAISAF